MALLPNEMTSSRGIIGQSPEFNKSRYHETIAHNRPSEQNLSWFLTNLIAAFLLPPLNLLLVAVAGLILLQSRPHLGKSLLIASITLLWLLSTSVVAGGAMHLLESGIGAVDIKSHPADAIVVLGGGAYPHAPEYGGKDTPGVLTLARLRYAAKLQRDTGKPILVTGGNPAGHDIPEAKQMKEVLENEFHVPVQWVEEASNNTFENARFSFPILQKSGIKRIYLVTHAWHMRRAIMAFQSAGFEVVPAPTFFSIRHDIDLLDFIPDAGSLWQSRMVMHELIGLVWYGLKS